MRLRLNLTCADRDYVLPINYQYPLSAAIYKIIERADEAYAEFLHDTGYTVQGKRFKLFTFSDLSSPFTIRGDRMVLQSGEASVIICFHVEEAAENFIKGLFQDQQLDIADRKSRVRFTVSQVEALPDPLDGISGEDIEVILEPLSPLVVGAKNDKGNYDFKGPADPVFAYWLIHNWIEKFRATPQGQFSDVHELKQKISVTVITPMQYVKSRLITIKAFTPQETKMRGFVKFRLKVKAPREILELALESGLGLYNAQGMGCVGVGGR